MEDRPHAQTGPVINKGFPDTFDGYRKRFYESIERYRRHGHDRQKAMGFICDQADPITSPVLDIGCGKGLTLLELASRQADVTGIDTSEEELYYAGHNLISFGLHNRARLVRGDAAALPFPDASFEMIFMINALHHLDDPVPILEDAGRVLMPGGRFVIADFTQEGFLIINRVHELDERAHNRFNHTIEDIITQATSLGFGCLLHTEGYQEDITVLRKP